MNQKLEDLLKGFKPRFGNTDDIATIERIGKMRKLQETVRKHDLRVKSLTTAVSRLTENQKRLKFQEDSLIASLEKAQHGTT